MAFFVGLILGGVLGLGAGILLAFYSCAKEIDTLDNLVKKSRVDLQELNGVIVTQDARLAKFEDSLLLDGHGKRQTQVSRF